MLLVLVLDGIAYLLAVSTVSDEHSVLVSVLADIFVAVALAHHQRRPCTCRA